MHVYFYIYIDVTVEHADVADIYSFMLGLMHSCYLAWLGCASQHDNADLQDNSCTKPTRFLFHSEFLFTLINQKVVTLPSQAY